MSGQDGGQEALVSFDGLPIRHFGRGVTIGVRFWYWFVVSCESEVVVRLKQDLALKLA